MGFDIPEPYVWDESFRVFYDSLDEEHKGLFKGIFDVANSPGDNSCLQHLAKAVKDHFVTEEAMMKSANYADLGSHKKIHDKFLGDLGTLKCPVNDGQVNFAKDWLVNHIKGTDLKYVGKLG
uniref:Hemerythrin n=1 Tax=Sternaspis scutata TaxID=36133 RepID=A0A1S6QCW8_9ANNE|nr:hemerythrin [Sternaspis scutata]